MANVRNSFEEWVLENYSEELDEIRNNGLEWGIHGLTYYSQTTAIYERFNDEIWDYLCQDAKDMGQTVIELIASFGYCRRDNVGSQAQFANILVWYAVERVAQYLEIEEWEQEEIEC
jgi:hypothetical protein